MARLERITPVSVPVHIIQRGNNRQDCFTSEEDFSSYLGWLKTYAQRYGVAVHAWVLMTNHVHLLCTPQTENSIGKMMQSMGRQYVRYFNYLYHRTGTLWEGRYKSCLVQSEQYLLEVYRYIELNPVRANMVDDPAKYRWSSYQVNALGKSQELCVPHPEYTALGSTPEERQESYRLLFPSHIDDTLLDDIRANTNSGLAIGHERFKLEIESLTGRRVQAYKRGRPLGLGLQKNKTSGQSYSDPN